MKERMELLTLMKEEMSRTRTSPKLLGIIELKESRIQFIMSSVGAPLLVFVASTIQSYLAINTADGDENE